MLLLIYKGARVQHDDALDVKEMQSIVELIREVPPHLAHQLGVVSPMGRLLARLGWEVIDWHTIRNHKGVDLDLRYASPLYLKRAAVQRHNELLARSINLDEEQRGQVFDSYPIRSVFRAASLRRKRLLGRLLSGTVLTAALTGKDGGVCPACGETDTVEHRIRRCWVSALAEADFRDRSYCGL